MKNLFAVSLLLLAASNVIWGAMVTCPPAQSTVIRDAASTPQVFTCGAVPDAVQVRYQVSLTFQDNSNGGPALSVFTSTSNDGGLTPLDCTAVGATNGDGQTLGACNAVSDWQAVAGLPAFSVTVTGGPGSDPLPFNASASVSYETVVPEPGQLGLIGFAMTCFGGLRKIRKARDSGSGGIWPFGD